MEKLNPSNPWPTCDLPEDLWPLILCFLPVITLLRFRCVSKSFRSLIDDPDFSLAHLTLFHKNHNESHLLVADETKMYISGLSVVHKYVLRCSLTFKTTAKLCFLLSDQDSPDTLTVRTVPQNVHRWNVISSINGLYMLRSESDILMLWNPAIRKTRILPPPPPEISQEKTMNVELGLGFDPLSTDYKHVRVVLSCTDDVHSVAVYTVRTNSWKVIEFRSEGACSSWRGDFGFQSKSVCIRGVLYVLSRARDSVRFKFITFDLSKEVFGSMEMPISVGSCVPLSNLYYQSITMNDGECELVVVHITPPNGCVWLLEDDGKSLRWSRACVFDMVFPFGDMRDRLCMPLYITNDWEMLVKRRSYVNRLYLCCWTHKERVLLKKNDAHQDNIWPYKENLYRFN